MNTNTPPRPAGAPWSKTVRLADLPASGPYSFDLRPAPEATAALAAELGLIGLRKLRFAGRLSPLGNQDWQLNATLGATVVQPCVATMKPVTTRIDEPVERTFVAQMPEPPASAEVEMPVDDTIEQLTEKIDLGAIMAEALALALPPWPRAQDAPEVRAQATAPGAEPLADEDMRPFAALKALRDKLGSSKD